MSEIMGNKPRRAKRSLALPVVIAGGVSSLLLAFSLTPTFSALTAQITNDHNTAGVGTLVMQEKNSAGTVTCLSSAGTNNSLASCSIDKYGGDLTMAPKATKTTTVTITNTGTTAASTFTLTPGTCKNAPTTIDLCSKVKVTVKATQGSNSATIINGVSASAIPTTAANILVSPLTTTVPAGGAVTFDITVAVDDVDNSFQGGSISQPLTWAFGA